MRKVQAGRRKRIVLLVVVAVLGVAGWIGWNVMAYGTALPMASNAGRDIRIARSSTGGLTGGGDGHDLTIEDSQIKYADKAKLLTTWQAAAITDKLDKADYFKLKEAYTTGCADGYTYVLEITQGAKSHTVMFDDCSNAPQALKDLDGYLTSQVE